MRRNTAFLFAARVTSAVTTLLVLSVVSRLRGPDALGEVGLGLAIGAIAAALADIGTATLLIRDAARDRAATRSILRVGLFARLLIVPFLLAGTMLIASLVGAATPLVVVLVAAGLVGQQTAELTRSVFNAQQRMAISGTHAIIENLVWAAVVCGAVILGAELTIAFALGLAVWLLSIGAGLLLIRLVGELPASGESRQPAVQIVRLALPFGAFNLTNVVSGRIDTVLLGVLLPTTGLAAAGAYYAAARLISAFEYLPDAISRARFPHLSRLATGDPAAVREVVGGIATNLLAIACLGPVIMVTAATALMTVLFGPELGDGAPILAAMSFVLPFRFLGYLFGMTLGSTDAQGRRVAAAAPALLVVLAFDIVGIPRIGVAAAVAGALAASAVLFFIYAWSVSERFGSTGLRPWPTLAIIGAMLLAIGVGLALGQAIPDVLAAGVATIAYVAVVAAGPLNGTVRRTMQPRTS